MQLQVFTFEQQDQLSELATIEINGEVWFVAPDVCKLLELENPTVALKGVDEDDKLTYEILRAGQKRKVNMVNESGLYNLMFRSNKPAAKRFKRWVTKEVLPSIRKTGAYGIDRSVLPNFMKRYQLNWAKTDKGHFSVIAMLYTTLYATLEKEGYTIPDKGVHGQEMRPDNSVGRLFSSYLQKRHPKDAGRHKTYMHTFPNGQEFQCRQYENELLHIFIKFVEDEWIPNQAERYFRERDIKALDYLPKLLKAG